MADSKLVTIESYGSIDVLGGLIGPITTPCNLDINTIVLLINSGKIVYEVNPKKTNEKIRLTRLNVRSNNFKPVQKAPVKQNTNHSDNKKKKYYYDKNESNDEKKTNVEETKTVEKLVIADAFVSNKKS